MYLSATNVTNDILKEIFSYTNPCNLLDIADTNDEIKTLTKDPSMLKKLSDDHYLPFYENITLEELCEYFSMNKERLVVAAAGFGDERVFFHWIPNTAFSYTSVESLFISAVKGENVKIFSFVVDYINKRNLSQYNSRLLWSLILNYNNDDLFKIFINSSKIAIDISDFSMIPKSFFRIILEKDDNYKKYLKQISFIIRDDLIDIVIDKYSHLWEPEEAKDIYNNIFLMAIELGGYATVKKLIKKADNYLDYSSGISKAAVYEKIDILKLLLDASNVAIEILNDALMESVGNGSIEIVSLLIDNGANDLNEALLDAIAYSDDLKLPELLIQKGADNLNDALHLAVWDQLYDKAELLLKYCADNYDEALLISEGDEKFTELINKYKNIYSKN